ncbi:hypothetical protein LJR016_002222 [Devosia sp. LjRoot16]|uniref:hypothetical protein n=1 Tax=Devosia sp. LjRoot16 TaxID=3342271 RepID=UPI003ED02689
MGQQIAMTPGFMVMLPWVKLPAQVSIGAFRFVPVDVDGAADVFGPEAAPLAMKAMRTHVDQGGKPITSCTVVLRPRSPVAWDVGRDHVDAAMRAAEILALCCLSEQQYFEGFFAAHLNAAMFFAIGMPLRQSEDISLSYPRRGMSLRVGGRTFSNTIFQQPPQVEGTRCDEVNARLLRALAKAKASGNPIWASLEAALQFFLLANAESMELNAGNCLLLSGVAFERLLGPPPNALELATAFAARWTRFPGHTLDAAKRVKPDHKPEWIAEQLTWRVHRKWMKELYEQRSVTAHGKERDHLSSNWVVGQHMVIAAFVFPLLLKVMLSDAGLYELTDNEEVDCEVVDDLLDSDWGNPKTGRQPAWPTIVGEARGAHGLRRAVERAMSEAGRHPK